MMAFCIVITLIIAGVQTEFVSERHFTSLAECNRELIKFATTSVSSNWIATCRGYRVA